MLRMEAVASGNAGMKKTRLVDIQKESSNDREQRGESSSILPSSPRSMISKWLSSIRRSRESSTQRSRLTSTVTLSRNKKDGTQDCATESSGDKRTSVVASLTRVVPENDELDLRMKRNELDQRRSRKDTCVKLPRPNFSKKAERGDDSFYAAVDKTEKIQMLSAAEAGERTEPILTNFEENNSFQNSTSSSSKSTQTVMPSDTFPGASFFSFGFGVGLAFLLSYRNEYNRMVEVQRQIEVLLKDIKDEMQKRDVSAYSRTFQPHSFVASDSNIQYDRFSKFDSTSETAKLHEIHQLEAELETELELLQLNLESENTSIRRQQCIEVVETSAAENLCEIYGEEDNHCGDFYSVCPYELERRLFELLQTRQQEHIEELEFALERARRELHEKEIEVSW
ncbi:protein POLAR-like 1 [Aristolochia californica]|uniref:protein POLAR-like 1 n=1 Tax=Aristolochia californica TaxID=171875 RepID=UPI0035DDE0E7